MAKKSGWVFKVVVAVLVLLVAFVVYLHFHWSAMARRAVEDGINKSTGTETSLGRVAVTFVETQIVLGKLSIGNPEGFHGANAIECERMFIDFQLSSIFGEEALIHDVHCENLNVNYELGLGGSNLGVILEHCQKRKRRHQEETGKAPKKYIIKKFVIDSGSVSLAAALPGGKLVKLPIEDMELKDIGKNTAGGDNIEAVVQEVIQAILSKVQVKAGESAGTHNPGDLADRAIDAGVRQLKKGVGDLLSGEKRE